MSKDKMKNLLNEGTIRRFMKLAEIDTLSDDFVDTLTINEAQDAEEAIEEGHYGMKMMKKHDDAEAPVTEEGAEEKTIEEMYHAGRDDEKELDEESVDEGSCGKHDDDEPMDEMAHPAKHDDDHMAKHDDEHMEEGAHEDAPAEDDADEPMMDEPAAEGADLATDLARGMAAVIEDVLGVSVAVEDGEADAEPAEPEMGDMDEPGLPEPEEDDEPLDDMPMMEEAELDMEALTREVTERVTARLQKESRQEKVADDLAERIIQRLKKQ